MTEYSCGTCGRPADECICKKEPESLTPLRAIHKHCVKCSGSQKQVRFCPVTDCDLFRYRFGKNPKRKGIGKIDNIRNPKKTSRRKEIEIKGDKKVKIIIEEIPD